MADSSPDLHTAHRRGAARIHSAGTICRSIPAHSNCIVRARCVLSIDRATLAAHDELNGANRSGLGIFTVAALGIAHTAVARSHSGMQPRQPRLSAVVLAAF